MNIKDTVRAVSRLFGSLRLTIVVTIALAVIFLLGLWVPQKTVLNPGVYLQWKEGSPALVRLLEFLHLTDIYTSPLTLTLWGLFFMNLTVVMWKRFPVILKQIDAVREQWEDPVSGPGFPHKAEITLYRDLSEEELSIIFRRHRFSLKGRPDRFYAIKNRLSPFATLLFHISFFLVLLGGVISIYTRFNGELVLSTGEHFQGEPEHYKVLRKPKIGTFPHAGFVIADVNPVMEGTTATSLKVTLLDRSGVKRVVEINRPYKVDNTSFVLRDIGLSPLAVVLDSEGREVEGAYVKLNVLRDRQDDFELYGYLFRVRFYPDYSVRDGQETSLSEEMRNPVFRITVYKTGKVVASGTNRPGEPFAFGGYQLIFREMPYWVKFLVVKEYGTGILYTGFAVAALSLIWRLIFFRRELVGSISKSGEDKVLHLAGRAEFYRSLAEDEFRQLAARIREEVS